MLSTKFMLSNVFGQNLFCMFIANIVVSFKHGTVSESGTGPLDYGATGPVPDP